MAIWFAFLLGAPAAAADRAAEERYARERARVEPRDLRIGGFTLHRTWVVTLGGRPVAHWTFLRQFRDITGEPLPDHWVDAFEPPNERNGAVMAMGFGVGGLTLVGGAAASLYGLTRQGTCRLAGRPGACTGAEDATTGGLVAAGIGGGVLLGTVVYVLATRSPRDPEDDVLTESDARARVARYNAALRRDLGLPPDAPATDPSREHRVLRKPPAPELTVVGLGLQVRF